jgi:hypothetical protein
MADSIQGRVTDQASAGIQGIQVTATDAQNQATNAQTDAGGNYAIANLQAGAYNVSVQLPGVPPPQPINNVNVVQGQDTGNINFQLAGVITGKVADKAGQGLQRQVTATQVVAFNGRQNPANVQSDANGNFIFVNMSPGKYTVRVDDAAGQPSFLPAHNVEVNAAVSARGIDFSEDIVTDFLGRLDDARFSIESLISEDEANQAVSLFSVVNLMLAGQSRRQVGSEQKLDMLGMLNLYYGLQEDSLRAKITVGNSTALWSNLEGELKVLAKDLDQLQTDVDFLSREAKRQFNLGLTNNVLGNSQFPALFRRYVEIGNDPLLSLDIKAADQPNSFVDKTRVAQADELLRELKGLILQIVRSLSKYGTAATRRANEDWARFESRALEILQTVARERVTPDQDERNSWAVLADLTNKNRETEIAPYVVLARHGGKLLNYAMRIYRETQNRLDDFDNGHLRDLFQNGNVQRDFWTERIRAEATVIKRYPLANWG